MSKTKKAPAKKTTKTSVKKSTKKATTVKAKASKTPAKKAASTKAKKATAAKSKTAKPVKDVESLELLNETGRRKANLNPPTERRKRRRQIDPTTCERDYNDPEIEFMQAMDDYKRQSGRMFPTCSEILEVMLKLGYRQVAEAAELMFDPNEDKKKIVEEESLNTRFDDEDDDDE